MNPILKKMYDAGATEKAIDALSNSYALRSALIGSTIGGVGGGAAGYATSDNDVSVDKGAVTRDVLKGIAMGALAGGVLGGAAGKARAAFHKNVVKGSHKSYLERIRQEFKEQDIGKKKDSPEYQAMQAMKEQATDAVMDKILSSKKSERLARAANAVVSAVQAVPTALGAGMLIRARFDEKFVEPEDKTLLQKSVSKAPHLLGLGTLLGSAAYGATDYALRKRVKDFSKVITKTGELNSPSEAQQRFLRKYAALKKDVKLKAHQEEAVAQLDRQGSLLAAHATGAGKTLTGIAGFEQLKKNGKATRAIVVVPAALRENFVDNIKRFTDSTHAVYGPRGESKTKNIGDNSKADYNIVSYDLFREHGDNLLESTGADTLIMDEVHRVRGTEGVTYNKLKELRPKFKNAVTLTGSIVNNEPNEVVPLLDITHGTSGHKLGTKKLFDSLFVNKTAKTYGFLFPKTHIDKKIKNKEQLRKVLDGKVSFISHKDLEADLPDKEQHVVEVEMSPEQTALYNYSMSSLDPITRWKIANNIPVGQREAKDAFSKSMQARQVSTDHGFLDKRLVGKNPYEYSPKIKKVVDDAVDHLGADPSHKTVIYGNLLKGQLESVEKALDHKGVPYARFYGLGNEGLTAKTRPEQIKDFMSNKKRVLLISGAGSEGLDLKDTSMMQMLEGHYNPEKIQQAEARVRRMGSFASKPKDQRKVIVKRYVSKPSSSKFDKFVGALANPFGASTGSTGIDKWIYSVADRKDSLNQDFREALVKKANEDLPDPVAYTWAHSIGSGLGGLPGGIIAAGLDRRGDKVLETKMKQMLLDRGMEEYTKKKHYEKILAESKLDERAIDADKGTGLALSGLSAAAAIGAYSGKNKAIAPLAETLLGLLPKTSRFAKAVTEYPEAARAIAAGAVAGMGYGLLQPPLASITKNVVKANAVGGGKDLDIGMNRYKEKLRKKMERKYTGSKSFVSEYDTRKDLGIEMVD
jgi:hypothetical protein